MLVNSYYLCTKYKLSKILYLCFKIVAPLKATNFHTLETKLDNVFAIVLIKSKLIYELKSYT